MTQEEIKQDMLKMIDKLDELDQKIINLNFKFSNLIKNFKA